MEQENKRKSKFAVLLVREKTDGVICQYQLNSLVLELAGVLLFVLGVIAICQIVYQSILITDIRNEMVEKLVTLNNLEDTGEALETENEILSDKVAVLSETVAKKTAAEEEREAETAALALPAGLPLSGGSISMEEEKENSQVLVFHASAGNHVVTAGTGIVESITPDEVYGTKLVLDHQNGYRSLYYNQGSPLVKTGETLGKGYILFQVGEDNTDLGYQIMKEEEYVDPMDMIEIKG